MREIKPEEVDAFRKQFSGSQAERGGASGSGGGQKTTQKLDAGKFKPLLEDAVKAQSQVADRCDQQHSTVYVHFFLANCLQGQKYFPN